MACLRPAASLALSMALALGACGETPEQAAPEGSSEAAAPATPSPAGEGGEAERGADPAALADDAEKGEAGARRVLLTWARALERKDFAAAYAAFGAAARERVGTADYAARFADYRTIAVSVPAGRIEGAAGSLYYRAPATVSGTTIGGRPYTLQGPVVLRRANDVPGATAEQLRWHIVSVELKPVN